MAGCSTPATASFNVPAYVPPAPAPPTNVTVSNITVTGVNTWTADVNFAPSPGATKPYPIFLDGTQIGTATASPASIQGTGPGQQHQVGVAACN